jgi:hypothetical protein
VLIAWWAVGTFAIYSWAGEKMPWLTIRPTVPMTILGAWGCWQVVRYWLTSCGPRTARPTADGEPADGDEPRGVTLPHRTALLLYAGGWVVALTLCYLLLVNFLRSDTSPNALITLVPIICVLIGALLTAAAWIVRGRRWAGGALLVTLSALLLVGTVRNSFQLNYRWGDVPREMLIYTQTSPDVERLVNRLRDAENRRSGEPFAIWYDSETVWSWYMRRFEQGRQQVPGTSNIPGPEVRAVLLMAENYTAGQQAGAFDGFVVQRLPLRWWFPEDQMYRMRSDWHTAPVAEDSSLLTRVLRTPNDVRTATQFWQFMLYRQLPAPLGSSDFYVAVRPDLAEEIGLGFGDQ